MYLGVFLWLYVAGILSVGLGLRQQGVQAMAENVGPAVYSGQAVLI